MTARHGSDRKPAPGAAKVPPRQPRPPLRGNAARPLGGIANVPWGWDFAFGAAVWAGFGALVLHYLGVIG